MSNFSYSRKIHFADTDSAGVVYFSNLLSICHEAYEEVLLSLGINLSNFFTDKQLAIPIIHAEIDFFKPLFCGDLINIQCQINYISDKVFDVNYLVEKDKNLIAKAITRHICINPETRESQFIPSYLKTLFDK
ncbi:thioesterase family protein [Cyanobacterium sp. Dongsha4]|uniref:acyl-CoA thioesterase n=1 Tax=Cyanobacterium sp. DS4 TaxID=2878255 RepID=UPI002E81124B|nr:thioesterase family protein [Cyanobacterium sp. Dongsha4]WVL02068.1 acyl-CoA thioesterase [Cyanobacterium sp. Dongsha4]